MYDTITTLTARNADFAQHGFTPGLSMMPTLRTMVIACADPRVDPAHVLGLANGDALVIRNIGGRYTPSTLQTMAALRTIAQAEGATPGPGWHLILLHHTDCGITRLGDHPDLLAATFGITEAEVPTKAVNDPHTAVAVDIAAIKNNPFLPANFIVTGLVYDVHTGLIDTVVAPSPLRETTAA
jgi:carbonic anhydrase